jgi:Asp-tRNA(Asn)/Glu-tRNA(Gln) amidotransferase A subunit family amidase
VSGDNVFENVIVHRDIPYQEGSSSSTERRGALAGWSVSVKDNFCTEGMPTSCSSLMLQDYQSPFEATAVKLLKKAGGVVIGCQYVLNLWASHQSA